MDIIETYEKPWFKEPGYIGVAFVFLFLFSLFIYTGYIDSSSEQVTLETKLSGTVKSTFNQRSILYISLSDPTRKVKLTTPSNFEYKEAGFTLMNMIEKGDKILKNENSDTIYLVKNGKSYFFELKEIKTHNNN